eukprot:gene9261-16949_t
MEDSNKDNECPFIDPWYSYSTWERDCIQHLEAEPDVEARLMAEKQAILDNLWASFQNAAKSVAQLYKGNSHTKPWTPFQEAANKVTLLYKDGSEAFTRACEYGKQIGYQKRNKDVLKWAKTRRKHVRREDLISFLCGRTSPRRRQSDSRTGLAALSVSPKPSAEDMFSARTECIANELSDAMNQIDVRKRNFSSDIIMESPNHKRQRFC